MPIRERMRELDARLTALPRKRLVLLMIGAAFLFLAVGTGLGFLIINRDITSSANGDGNATNGSNVEVTSLTGVLRSLSEPKDGIEFYLEEQDDTRVLLDTAGRFDSAFLERNVGLIVTVQGTMAKTTIDSENVFLVEKLVISF